MLGDSLMDFQGTQSQKKHQKDQGTLKLLGGALVLLPLLGPPGLPSGSSPASSEIHQTSVRKALLKASL